MVRYHKRSGDSIRIRGRIMQADLKKVICCFFLNFFFFLFFLAIKQIAVRPPAVVVDWISPAIDAVRRTDEAIALQWSRKRSSAAPLFRGNGERDGRSACDPGRRNARITCARQIYCRREDPRRRGTRPDGAARVSRKSGFCFSFGKSTRGGKGRDDCLKRVPHAALISEKRFRPVGRKLFRWKFFLEKRFSAAVAASCAFSYTISLTPDSRGITFFFFFQIDKPSSTVHLWTADVWERTSSKVRRISRFYYCFKAIYWSEIWKTIIEKTQCTVFEFSSLYSIVVIKYYFQ